MQTEKIEYIVQKLTESKGAAKRIASGAGVPYHAVSALYAILDEEAIEKVYDYIKRAEAARMVL